MLSVAIMLTAFENLSTTTLDLIALLSNLSLYIGSGKQSFYEGSYPLLPCPSFTTSSVLCGTGYGGVFFSVCSGNAYILAVSIYMFNALISASVNVVFFFFFHAVFTAVLQTCLPVAKPVTCSGCSVLFGPLGSHKGFYPTLASTMSS